MSGNYEYLAPEAAGCVAGKSIGSVFAQREIDWHSIGVACSVESPSAMEVRAELGRRSGLSCRGRSCLSAVLWYVR